MPIGAPTYSKLNCTGYLTSLHLPAAYGSSLVARVRVTPRASLRCSAGIAAPFLVMALHAPCAGVRGFAGVTACILPPLTCSSRLLVASRAAVAPGALHSKMLVHAHLGAGSKSGAHRSAVSRRVVRCMAQPPMRDAAGQPNTSQMLVFVPPHPLIKHWLAVARSSATPPQTFRSALAELGRLLIYEVRSAARLPVLQL